MIKYLLKEVAETLNPQYQHGDIKRENILINKAKEGKFHAYLAEPNFLQDKVSFIV